MVTMKKAAVADLGGTSRSLTGRLKRLDASAAATAATGRKPALPQLKTARRQDQRSTVSIARSGACGTSRSSCRSTPRRGSVCSSRALGVARMDTRRQPAFWRPLARPRTSGSGSFGVVGGRGRRLVRTNSGASNSAGAEPPLNVVDNGEASGWCRTSAGTHRLGGKTVSITASHDGGMSYGSRLNMPTRSEVSKRSIIKLRPLPTGDQLCGAHNEDGTTREGKSDHAGMTLHQQREQKIFGDCRFIPCDSFYKKVYVAPNQDRQFFAAPKCNRVSGSRMLYDIANENRRHHHDCNIDFTRDQLRRSCSTYCRPSQFRHIY